MIYLEDGLYLRVQELPESLQPLPLRSGFFFCCYGFLVLSNDRNEIWFISNRHLRTQGLVPADKRLRSSDPHRVAHEKHAA